MQVASAGFLLEVGRPKAQVLICSVLYDLALPQASKCQVVPLDSVLRCVCIASCGSNDMAAASLRRALENPMLLAWLGMGAKAKPRCGW